MIRAWIILKEEPDKNAEIKACYTSERACNSHLRLLQNQTPIDLRNKVLYNIQCVFIDQSDDRVNF